MKKELFAGALLALILALSMMNTWLIGSMCGEISDAVAAAGSRAEQGDWEGSSRALNDAMRIWSEREPYAKIVLRHTDIETLTDDFYELTEHIYTREQGAVKSAVELVTEHLRGIAEMESINFGSIF